MKAARFEVTLDLLASALRLPEGATIRRISGDEAQQTIRRTVMVLVEGAPGMPDVLEGAYPPSIRPDVDDEGNLFWEGHDRGDTAPPLAEPEMDAKGDISVSISSLRVKQGGEWTKVI